MLVTSLNLWPLHREALGKRKSFSSDWCQPPPGKSSTWSLTLSQELISLNQMKGLRRSHEAKSKIYVKENTRFCEVFEGPAFKKGHHTFRTSELAMLHMQLLICKKCLHKYLIPFTVGRQFIWKRKWELGVETCLLVSFFFFHFSFHLHISPCRFLSPSLPNLTPSSNS